MIEIFQPADTGIFQLVKPVRNPAYKRFVKRFACAACGSTRLVDPAHTGEHGLGSKSSDLSVIPLCRDCHMAFDADPFGFAREQDLDVPATIAFLNHEWEEKQRRTA